MIGEHDVGIEEMLGGFAGIRYHDKGGHAFSCGSRSRWVERSTLVASCI